jgi:ribosome-binding factor A
MKRDRPRRRGAAPEFHPDAGAELPAQARRKQQQLCRQVEERLGLVLAGEVDDPLLQDLWVVDVAPEPGGGRMVVRLARAPGTREVPAAALLPRLDALRPFLRGEIATAIHRKRTPDLVFQIVDLAGGARGDA